MVYWGYVTRYRLEYSYEGNHWIRYKDNKQNSTSLGFTVSGVVGGVRAVFNRVS